MQNDIIVSENPVTRRSRPSTRVEVKQEVAEGAPEPERKTKRVRPGSVNGVVSDRLVVSDAIRRKYPDCVFFWENVEKGKPEVRESIGWEKCKDEAGNVIMIPVGQGETGPSINAVLMALPVEWYEEDLKRQEEQSRQVMNSLRRGSNPQDVNSDGSYAPRLPNGKVGLSVEQGTR
jgi:hypothetical protein